MRKGKYRQVILIGFGDIYKKILKYLILLKDEWDFKLEIVEHELYAISRIRGICEESEVSYHKFQDKEKLLSFFLEFNEPTLIISAGNKYLFPRRLLEKSNITVVNFHNALLPSYPGRNAPSWAIYNDEKYSGATWHVVTDKIDAGEILWQGSCVILPDAKAYELVRAITNLAYQGFVEIAENLFEGNIEGKAQKIDMTARKVYYSKDVPGNGIVKITDSPEYIYRVLRATDYGLYPIFPKIRIVMENGELCTIKRYKKEVIGEEVKNEALKKYYLKLNDGFVLAIDISRVAEEVKYAILSPNIREYNCLRVSVGWEEVSDYLAKQAMEQSIVIMARARGKLIGMARMISDGGMLSFIVDVMVHPDFQDYGIGTVMVKNLLAVQKAQLMDGEYGYVSVLATTGKERFYKMVGFAERPNLMLGAGMTVKVSANKMNKFER